MYSERKFLNIRKICLKWSLVVVLLFALGTDLYVQDVSAKRLSGDAQSENTIPDSNSSEFAKSKHMWKYSGTIYTVKDIQGDGYVSISGNYVDTMAIYKDRIYWRKTTELGHFPCEIIQMNLDCTEQKVLTESADSYIGITIYKDWLYYISLDQNEKRTAKKINLETLEEEDAPPYILRAGDENSWYGNSLNKKDHNIYRADPGFENPQSVPEIQGECLGVYHGVLYYMNQEEDGTYTTFSYDPVSKQNQIILQGNQFKSICSGKGLYYKTVEDGNVTLHRQDLQNDARTSFGFGNFNVYMGGGMDELDDDLYVTRFLPEQEVDNTEMWKISLTEGKPEKIGSWYNPNAENASKE